MTKFNLSRFARSVGCFATVTAVLLSASATHAGSYYGSPPPRSMREPNLSTLARVASTPLPAINRNPMTAPSPTPPRYYDINRVRQGRWEGLHGEGCFGKPRLPQSVNEQLRPKPMQWDRLPMKLPRPPQSVNEQLRPKPLKIDEWDERAGRLLEHTSSTHRLVPNRIPMR